MSLGTFVFLDAYTDGYCKLKGITELKSKHPGTAINPGLHCRKPVAKSNIETLRKLLPILFRNTAYKCAQNRRSH